MICQSIHFASDCESMDIFLCSTAGPSLGFFFTFFFFSVFEKSMSTRGTGLIRPVLALARLKMDVGKLSFQVARKRSISQVKRS